ncbi:hypothetical protein [Bacillus sp. UMB0893]|uniref:hypothetical protein n=1 Tax=Bacillus sp. UMB0893 TaxID=2066053 RepID=UPI001C60A194|nr:hypothetical protein [Bacillus sp. UMB0893]
MYGVSSNNILKTILLALFLFALGHWHHLAERKRLTQLTEATSNKQCPAYYRKNDPYSPSAVSYDPKYRFY